MEGQRSVVLQLAQGPNKSCDRLFCYKIELVWDEVYDGLLEESPCGSHGRSVYSLTTIPTVSFTTHEHKKLGMIDQKLIPVKYFLQEAV